MAKNRPNVHFRGLIPIFSKIYTTRPWADIFHKDTIENLTNIKVWAISHQNRGKNAKNRKIADFYPAISKLWNG